MLTLDHQMARLWADHREEINKEVAAIFARLAHRAAQAVRPLATAVIRPPQRLFAGLATLLASSTFIGAALLPAWDFSGTGGAIFI